MLFTSTFPHVGYHVVLAAFWTLSGALVGVLALLPLPTEAARSRSPRLASRRNAPRDATQRARPTVVALRCAGPEREAEAESSKNVTLTN